MKHDFGQYASQGIYQVRYAGRRIGVEVEANPERSFSLGPSRTMVSIAREGQFNSLWFEVPLNADTVTFQGIGASGMIRDETGRKVAKFRHGSATEVAMGAFRGKLLNLSVKGGRTGDYYRFGVSGMTPIYAADAETARAIGAKR